MNEIKQEKRNFFKNNIHDNRSSFIIDYLIQNPNKKISIF